MNKGHFDYFVLLPSQITQENAQKIKTRFGKNIFIEPLPEAHCEDNADKCFAHYNNIIQQYMEKFHCMVDDIELDITRGTKVMGAALYSAGLRHGVYRYRYITSEKRDKTGQVIPGTEDVYQFNASVGMFLSKIDQAKVFLKSYNFEAVTQLFADEKSFPDIYMRVGRYICQCAQFYGAWQRLDYQKAVQNCPDWGESVPKTELSQFGLEQLIVNETVIQWVNTLNRRWEKINDIPDKDVCLKKSEQAIKIAVDLLANGRRQVDIGNYEDAIVRAYRILEMMGQIWLFQKGYDTAYIPSEDENVKAFIERLQKDKKNLPTLKKNAYYEFSREMSAHFINSFEKDKNKNDRFGTQLINFMKSVLSADERNQSVLIHGFTVFSSKEAKELSSVFNQIEKMVKDNFPESQDYLQVSQKINLFKSFIQ